MVTADRAYCHRCRRETEWRARRRDAKHLRCEGCGDVFPCRSRCGHLDCEEARAAAAARSGSSPPPKADT